MEAGKHAAAVTEIPSDQHEVHRTRRTLEGAEVELAIRGRERDPNHLARNARLGAY